MSRETSGAARYEWLTRPFSPEGGLLSVTLIGFCGLSILATAMGFIDLRMANASNGQIGIADLIVSVVLTGFVVCAMVVALHNVVSAGRRIWVRLVALVFYSIFAIWSVGFGFGFFWKEIAGREFTRQQFELVVSGLSGSVGRANDLLSSADKALAESAVLARERALIEQTQGRTCANRPMSTPGDGALTRSRFAFAERAEDLTRHMRADWLQPLSVVRRDMSLRLMSLQGQVVEAEAGSVLSKELEDIHKANDLSIEERRKLYARIFEGARMFAEQSNASRDLYAVDLVRRINALANVVGPDPERPGAADPSRIGEAGYCWDVVLHQNLQEAASRVAEIDAITPPQFDFLEGPAATRTAFFSLLGWMKAVVGMEGEGQAPIPFGDKEFLALFASLAVDLGIFFLTLVRANPPTERTRRFVSGGGVEPRPPELTWIDGKD